MFREINRQNFGKEIYQSDMPVLLDFFAPWCTPCKMLSNELEKLSASLDGKLRVCRVNVDSEKDLADKYLIREIPTVFFFKSGIPTDRFTGYRSAEELDAIIAKNL